MLMYSEHIIKVKLYIVDKSMKYNLNSFLLSIQEYGLINSLFVSSIYKP